VVSRRSLPDIQKVIPARAFGLLLKPVKRPVLQAFLVNALKRSSTKIAQDSDGAKAAGNNSEELLQALLEANIRLQECDQDRTNFLARALHDFRTPLTALQGYCEMLIRQSAGPLDPDQIVLLQRMQHSIGRLSKMSRGMFELSVHHTAETKSNLVKANIDTCIQNAVHQIVPIAQDKDLALNIDLAPPNTCFLMDPAAIEQVLVNLLENACKFTPRGGAIEIRGRLSYSNRMPAGSSGAGETRTIPIYKVELQDTGMGIQPEHLDSVFEEFTSYAGARDRSGGGLGLAICKMLVTAHKGTIWAESDRQGTTISFTLPAEQEVALRAPSGVVERSLVTGAA
jgi:two-component system sensor histidine kinase BarA